KREPLRPPFTFHVSPSTGVGRPRGPPRTQPISTHRHNRFADKFHSRFVYSAVVAGTPPRRSPEVASGGSATLRRWRGHANMRSRSSVYGNSGTHQTPIPPSPQHHLRRGELHQGAPVLSSVRLPPS